MNWKKVAYYGAALFFAQSAIGFMEGLFSPLGTMGLLVSLVVSFLAGATIFAHLGTRQSKPFLHAWAALAFQGLLGAALLLAVTSQFGSIVSASVAGELLGLAGALLVGTTIGAFWRRRAESSAEA